MRNILNSEAIQSAVATKSRYKRKAEKVESYSPEESGKKEKELDTELSALREKICDAESKKQILDRKKARLEEDIKSVDSLTARLSNSKSVSSLVEKSSKQSTAEDLIEKTKNLAQLVKSARMLQTSSLKSGFCY